MRIDWDGPWIRKQFLILAHIIVFCNLLWRLASRGRAFGVLKLLREFHFLVGKRHGVRFWLVIIWWGFWMAGWCCMCRCSGETVDHLLKHCVVAREVWDFVFRSFGVTWVLPGRVKELMSGWRNWFGKNRSEVWNTVPLCLMWTLWQECNHCTFEDIENPIDKIIEVFMDSLFDWSCAQGVNSSPSLGAFLESLEFSIKHYFTYKKKGAY